MSLTTGTPLGTITSQEETYVEGAPYFYIQDATRAPLNNPDADGFYWMMSGTSSYPVYNIGCVQDVSLTENVTMNAIRCDTVGDKGTIQKRNYIDFNITITSLFPLTVLRHLMNLSTPDVSTGLEKVGIGSIDNNVFYMVYAPKVYDETNGDYLLFHLHRAQFVDAWTINMTQGEPWKLTGLKLRAYADTTKPDSQKFGVIIRSDTVITSP